MAKKLGESSSKEIQENILLENPEGFQANEKVHVFKEVPPMENIVFSNYRDPGVILSFHYASATHPLKHYDLIPGKQYNLPVEVIRHLEGDNKSDPYSCHRREYGQRMGPDGRTETFIKNYVPYFQCKTVRAA